MHQDQFSDTWDSKRCIDTYLQSPVSYLDALHRLFSNGRLKIVIGDCSHLSEIFVVSAYKIIENVYISVLVLACLSSVILAFSYSLAYLLGLVVFWIVGAVIEHILPKLKSSVITVIFDLFFFSCIGFLCYILVSTNSFLSIWILVWSICMYGANRLIKYVAQKILAIRAFNSNQIFEHLYRREALGIKDVESGTIYWNYAKTYTWRSRLRKVWNKFNKDFLLSLLDRKRILPPKLYPRKIRCPHCSEMIELFEAERRRGKFICSICENIVILKSLDVAKTRSESFVTSLIDRVQDFKGLILSSLLISICILSLHLINEGLPILSPDNQKWLIGKPMKLLGILFTPVFVFDYVRAVINLIDTNTQADRVASFLTVSLVYMWSLVSWLRQIDYFFVKYVLKALPDFKTTLIATIAGFQRIFAFYYTIYMIFETFASARK